MKNKIWMLHCLPASEAHPAINITLLIMETGGWLVEVHRLISKESEPQVFGPYSTDIEVADKWYELTCCYDPYKYGLTYWWCPFTGEGPYVLEKGRAGTLTLH